MRIKGLAIGAVAALLVATSAAAQSEREPPAPKERPDAGETNDSRPDETATPAAADITGEARDADKLAREAHLGELFRRLADPEAKDWQRVQAQIIQAWNNSGSDSMDLLASRADTAMEKKDYTTALLHLNDLIRLAPDFAEAWNKRATVHFLQEDYGPSLEDIARVLRLEPRHFGALAGLGIILDRIGDPKGALEAYRRAIAINPHLPGIMDGIEKLEKQVEGERL